MVNKLKEYIGKEVTYFKRIGILHDVKELNFDKILICYIDENIIVNALCVGYIDKENDQVIQFHEIIEKGIVNERQ